MVNVPNEGENVLGFCAFERAQRFNDKVFNRRRRISAFYSGFRIDKRLSRYGLWLRPQLRRRKIDGFLDSRQFLLDGGKLISQRNGLVRKFALALP